ncbi:MAG TPA: hypothetical protein VF666_04460 [Pyrinomonadaceae bacterium]
MSDNLTRETFAPLLHTKFRLHFDETQSVEVELVEVSAEDFPQVEGMERFTLVFHIPVKQPIPQRTYQMEHVQIGTFAIFIVPIGHDAEGFRYEAVFNRLAA